MQGDDIHMPVRLHHPYDSNNQIVVSTVGYEGRNCVNTRLSVEAVRDIQRLGHLGLGKHSYWELGRILLREGIMFPIGGIKGLGMRNGPSLVISLLQLPLGYIRIGPYQQSRPHLVFALITKLF